LARLRYQTYSKDWIIQMVEGKGHHRGGPRVGAGRPPKAGSVRWQREQRKRRRSVGDRPSVPRASLPIVARPSDLPAGQAAVWDMLAPRALEQRTLTLATAFAFREMCEAIVLKRDILAVIEADGLMSSRVNTKMDEKGGGDQVFESKSHPLIAKWTALKVRVESDLTRFRLHATGKELPAAEEPADEFAEFDQLLTLVKGGK
ncbi:MAG: hypothetical protein ABIH03_10785, partial [Pseudomonadota bacterium]